jgi:hypothetical protein
LWQGDGLKSASPHVTLQFMDGLGPRYAAKENGPATRR